MDRFKLIAAVHLFLFKDDKILLLRRFNTGYEDGNYGVPAGHLDGNEPITVGMAREAREEAGITISPENLQVIHVVHCRFPGSERINFFLTTDVWQGELCIGEPDKSDQVGWFSLDKLPTNIILYVRFALDKYRSGIFFSEFGW